MKTYFYLALVLICAVPHSALAQLNIFTCEPEWAALATEIGGDDVDVFSATHAKQDAHYIRARPSLIAKTRRADIVFCTGASLEEGWLPILLQKAKAGVQHGQAGHLMAASLVPLLEKPAVLDRGHGHVHAEGNPHMHLNPHHLLRVAQELAARLSTIDAANADAYTARLADFSSRWHAAIARWEAAASGLKGKQVVVHHRGFSYLLDWLGIEQAASLEPKPGIPPTSAHLEQLLQQFGDVPADVIIRTPYEPKDGAEWLAQKTETPAIVLPFTVGGDEQSGDLFALFDRSIALLKQATHVE